MDKKEIWQWAIMDCIKNKAKPQVLTDTLDFVCVCQCVFSGLDSSYPPNPFLDFNFIF